MSYDRTVEVSRDWFEKLEGYLDAGERVCHKALYDHGSYNLILFVPDGKRLIFVPEKESI